MDELTQLKVKAFDLARDIDRHTLAIKELQMRLQELLPRIHELERLEERGEK